MEYIFFVVSLIFVKKAKKEECNLDLYEISHMHNRGFFCPPRIVNAHSGEKIYFDKKSHQAWWSNWARDGSNAKAQI